MKTEVPKVLHEICGRPMLAYVLDACRGAGVSSIYVVVGYGAEQVRSSFEGQNDLNWVVQQPQRGTADAVNRCRPQLAGFDGRTVVLCGDVPLVRPQTVRALIEAPDKGGAIACLATAVLDDPTGYGRIVRNGRGEILAIVEQFDCDQGQEKIKEVNPSFYVFDNKALFETLERVKPDNAKKEYYLTDVVGLLISDGRKVEAVKAVEPREAIGINSRSQLAAAAVMMQRRIQGALMAEGVTIVDPDKTWICSGAVIGRDTVVEPFTYIGGEVRIGRCCTIGPFAFIGGGTILEDGSVVAPKGPEPLQKAE
jgi:bifunctional UDP-N-acetylglucosamine pyrophosphorylase/glucosamine-1-phosphate N-acetyltransferase